MKLIIIADSTAKLISSKIIFNLIVKNLKKKLEIMITS